MNTLNRAEQRWILKLLCRDNSIADIVDVTGHSSNTVRRHLARFGEALLATHDKLVRNITPTRRGHAAAVADPVIQPPPRTRLPAAS